MADERDKQIFFQGLLESGRYSLDEIQALKRLDFALVKKLFGGVLTEEMLAPQPPAHIDLCSPNGTVWRLTITDEGRARTAALTQEH